MNIRKEKGITLIALIITIVILIILAGVAISSIDDTEVIKHANNAKQEFIDIQNEENKFKRKLCKFFKKRI